MTDTNKQALDTLKKARASSEWSYRDKMMDAVNDHYETIIAALSTECPKCKNCDDLTLAYMVGQGSDGAREYRTGHHLFEEAKKLGWPDDGEGALNFIIRYYHRLGECDERMRWCADKAMEGHILVPLEPTDADIDAGAQALASFQDNCVWPDSWSPEQIAGMRHDARKVWRYMTANYRAKEIPND